MAMLPAASVPRELIEKRIEELVAQRHQVERQLAAYSAAIGELEALIAPPPPPDVDVQPGEVENDDE